MDDTTPSISSVPSDAPIRTSVIAPPASLSSILVVGDALAQQGFRSGWLSCLANDYVRRADIINRGLSGYSTSSLLRIINHSKYRSMVFPMHLRMNPPLFVILCVGSTDKASNEQRVPLDKFETNLESIVDSIRQHVKPKHGIVLVTPPAVDETQLEAYLQEKGRTTASRTGRNLVHRLSTTRDYRLSIINYSKRQAAKGKRDLVVADMFLAMLDYNKNLAQVIESATTDPPSYRAYLANDGINLSEAGGTLLFEEITRAIANSPLASKMAPDAVPYGLPSWREMVALPERE